MRLIRTQSYDHSLKKPISTFVSEHDVWNQEDFYTNISIGECYGSENPNILCQMISNACMDYVLEQDPLIDLEVECTIHNQNLYIIYFTNKEKDINCIEIIKRMLTTQRVEYIKHIHEESVLTTFQTRVAKVQTCFGVAENLSRRLTPLASEIAYTLMKTYEAMYLYINPKLHKNVKIEVHVREGCCDERLQRGINEEGVISPDFGKRFFGIYIQKVIFTSTHVAFDDKLELNKIKDELSFKLTQHIVAHYNRYTNCEMNSRYRYKANLQPIENRGTGAYEMINFPSVEIVFEDRQYQKDKTIAFGTNHNTFNHSPYYISSNTNLSFDTSKTLKNISRLGSYYARYIAKNIVKNKLAKKCEVKLTFDAFEKQVQTIEVTCFPHKMINEKQIKEQLNKHFSFDVEKMYQEMKGSQVKLLDTIVSQHFYLDEFPWEKTIRFNQDEEEEQHD